MRARSRVPDSGLSTSVPCSSAWTTRLKGHRSSTETMVFGGENDGAVRRYVTRAEALAGHAEVVADVSGKAGI